jgi:hypothetical protein
MPKLREIIGDAFLVDQLHEPPSKYSSAGGVT